MHAPPPVRVTLEFDRAWRIGCAGLGALAAANAAAWMHPALWVVLPAALVGALAALGWVRVRRATGALAWDGQVWLWEPAGAEALPGAAAVAIDLDRWMLLRFTPEHGARRWLPLSRAAHAAVWLPLRAALFGARPAPEPTI
jgi:hypothetical protein